MEALHTSLLEPAELSTIAVQIVEAIDLSTHPFLGQIAALVLLDAAEVGRVLARVRANSHTARLAELDAARDNAFIALRGSADTAVRRPIREVVAAGEALQEIFERHGTRLHRFGYPKQSAKLLALVEELEREINTPRLALIGATPLLAELKAAQVLFEATFDGKIDEEALRDIPELEKVRTDLSVHLTLLLGNLEVLPKLNPPTAIETFEKKIDELITAVMSPARARRTREESAGQTTGAATPTGAQ